MDFIFICVRVLPEDVSVALSISLAYEQPRGAVVLQVDLGSSTFLQKFSQEADSGDSEVCLVILSGFDGTDQVGVVSPEHEFVARAVGHLRELAKTGVFAVNELVLDLARRQITCGAVLSISKKKIQQIRINYVFQKKKIIGPTKLSKFTSFQFQIASFIIYASTNMAKKLSFRVILIIYC